MWHSFLVRFYTDSREVKGENDCEGGGESGKISLFCLLTPSPIDFWFDLGSAFARLHLLLYEPQKKEQKRPPATQAMSALRRESLSYSREIYNHVHRK